MKYKCDMIRDMMPLCADKSATEESENALIEHLAECEACKGYWEKTCLDLSFDGGSGENTKNYTEIAAKLRVKKRVVSIVVGLAVGLAAGAAVTIAGNVIGMYVDGYRPSPEKALAVSQNNIGVFNEKIGEYEWNGGVKFYFYKNQLYTACYGVEKSWFGWRHNVTYLSDLPEYNGKGIVNHLRGIIHYGNDGVDDKTSVHMLPISVYDDNVAKITIISGGNEYSTDVYAGYTGVLTFESTSDDIPIIKGFAYDKEGNVLYNLDNLDEYELEWVEAKISQ